MTTGRRTARPRLPEPPRDYDPEYFSQLIRAIENFMDEQGEVGPGRFSEITLTNTPGEGGGQEVGYVYHESGTLKIVLSGDILASSLAATGRVGSVTVTTT